MQEPLTCKMYLNKETTQLTEDRKNGSYENMDEQESNQHGWINVMTAIGNCLMIFNSSINFYIYYGKYRKHFNSNNSSCCQLRKRNVSQPLRQHSSTQSTRFSTTLSNKSSATLSVDSSTRLSIERNGGQTKERSRLNFV